MQAAPSGQGPDTFPVFDRLSFIVEHRAGREQQLIRADALANEEATKTTTVSEVPATPQAPGAYSVEDPAEDLPPANFVSCRVTPVINGVELRTAGLFDALWVLARNDNEGEFWPFNCSCGSPGCAGIFDEARLLVTPKTVTWSLPIDPFGRSWPEAFKARKDPMSFVFDRGEYLLALESLLQQLEAVEASYGLPAFCSVDEPYQGKEVDEVPGELRKRIANARTHMLAMQAEEAKRDALLAPIKNTKVELRVGDETLTAWATVLVRELEWMLTVGDPDEEVLEPVILPAFKSPEELWKLVQKRPFEYLCDAFRPSAALFEALDKNWPPADEQLTLPAMVALQAHWPHNASITLIPDASDSEG